MLIRHTGVFVKDIALVSSILCRLGFENIYDEIELIEDKKRFVRKFKSLDNEDFTLEIIEGWMYVTNSFHLSFYGEIPSFLKQYDIVKFEPKDNKLDVYFVYINDSIYFEFVRNKNDL